MATMHSDIGEATARAKPHACAVVAEELAHQLVEAPAFGLCGERFGERRADSLAPRLR